MSEPALLAQVVTVAGLGRAAYLAFYVGVAPEPSAHDGAVTGSHSADERADPVEADSPVETLRRWENFGATWRVVARAGSTVTVALCRCDGGEEVQRLTSADPALIGFLKDRSRSES